MFFAVPGRSGVTIVYQNESWLIYCATWDFPVMLRNQKKYPRIVFVLHALEKQELQLRATLNGLF